MSRTAIISNRRLLAGQVSQQFPQRGDLVSFPTRLLYLRPVAPARSFPLNRSGIPWTVLVAFAVVWFALAGSGTSALVFGIIAVGGAGMLHHALGGPPEARFRVGGLLAFVPYFLTLTVRGGLDVSRRALSPSIPVHPDVLTHRVRLPEGAPLVLFVGTLSLLPGTLSAALEGDELTVHVLAHDATSADRVRELEDRVSDVFGIALETTGSSE